MKYFLSRIAHYVSYFLPLKRWFFLAVLTGVLSAAASGFGIPVIVYKVFPAVFNPDEMPEIIKGLIQKRVSPENFKDAVLLVACTALPMIFIIRGLAMWVNAVTVNYLGLRILENIRISVFTRLQSLPFSFYEKQRSGDLLSRIITDSQNVQTMLMQVSADIVKQPLTAISALAALVYVLWGNAELGMFLSSLLFSVLAILPVLIIGKRVVRKSRQSQENIGEMTAVVQENLASQREIRAYKLEDREVERLARTSDKYCIAQLKTVKYQTLLTPALEIITAIALAFVLVGGCSAGMKLTDFMAIAGALFFAFDAIKRTGLAYNKVKQAQASLERVEMILTATDTMPDPEHPVEISEIKGNIEFKNFSFEYEEGKPILKDINVSIPAGQVVALVGPSGSGKTTFASMIPRFYDASNGELFIDGINIKSFRKKELRKYISLVSQFAVLFRNTILENIRLGKLNASDEEVLHSAKLAALDSFLDDKSDGISTCLTEGGEGVSGGQRQRIAIARAFLKDAPILILDEATSALDAESEKIIQNNLEGLVKGRTAFIVAHRFSSIRIAQRILVFNAGRIVGDGTHDELYHSCPLYKTLYDKQGVN